MKKNQVHVYVNRKQQVVVHRGRPRKGRPPKKSSGLLWKIIGAGALIAALS